MDMRRFSGCQRNGKLKKARRGKAVNGADQLSEQGVDGVTYG
jgi:hypothetical protein